MKYQHSGIVAEPLYRDICIVNSCTIQPVRPAASVAERPCILFQIYPHLEMKKKKCCKKWKKEKRCKKCPDD